MTFEEVLKLGDQINVQRSNPVDLQDTVRDDILRFILASYTDKQDLLRRKESRHFLRKVRDELDNFTELYLFNSDYHALKRYFYRDKPAWFVDYKKMMGCHFVNEDDENEIIYFLDMFISPYRLTPKEHIRRNLVATIAHERCHAYFEDAKNDTALEVAEPRADCAAIAQLKRYYNELYSHDKLSDSDFIEFLKEIPWQYPEVKNEF